MKAWCIKEPDGALIVSFTNTEKRECRHMFLRCCRGAHGGWKGLYKQGYRCVRVVIKEATK
jgi:hypothetical protein